MNSESVTTVLHDGDRLEVYSKYAGRVMYLGVGFVPAGKSGRKVFRGPLVPGPWAFTFATPVVISRFPTAPHPSIPAAIGDLFYVDGCVYRLTDDDPYDYPSLTPVPEEDH